MRQLPNVPSAKFQSIESGTVRRSACTPNTRVELLQQIQAWADNQESEKVYWLNGMADRAALDLMSARSKLLAELARDRVVGEALLASYHHFLGYSHGYIMPTA